MFKVCLFCLNVVFFSTTHMGAPSLQSLTVLEQMLSQVADWRTPWCICVNRIMNAALSCEEQPCKLPEILPLFLAGCSWHISLLIRSCTRCISSPSGARIVIILCSCLSACSFMHEIVHIIKASFVMYVDNFIKVLSFSKLDHDYIIGWI